MARRARTRTSCAAGVTGTAPGTGDPVQKVAGSLTDRSLASSWPDFTLAMHCWLIVLVTSTTNTPASKTSGDAIVNVRLHAMLYYDVCVRYYELWRLSEYFHWMASRPASNNVIWTEHRVGHLRRALCTRVSYFWEKVINWFLKSAYERSIPWVNQRSRALGASADTRALQHALGAVRLHPSRCNHQV